MSTDLNLLECVDLIEETKENSKNALIEKGLEIDESYGLSQVDEKIAEIQAGSSGDDFSCTFNSIGLYTNVDDPEPSRYYYIGNIKTVKNNLYLYSNVILSCKKIVFDMTVNNVSNNYTGDFSVADVQLYSGYSSNKKITTSGRIENGTGNVQASIESTNSYNIGITTNSLQSFVNFLFGDPSKNDNCNIVNVSFFIANN